MSDTPAKPNMRVEFVDAHTGAVLGSEEFWDPYLAWVLDEDTGQVHLTSGFGCGVPLQSWLDENPPNFRLTKPKRLR